MTLVVGIIFLLIHTSQIGAQFSGDNCTTPNLEAGECINIKNCSGLVEDVKEFEEQKAAAYLRESTCGFEGLDPLVCCPETSSRFRPWNTWFWTTRAPAPVRAPVRQPSPSVPNRFSSNCGRSNVQIDRIVGGDNAALGAWPWIAALGYQSRTRAGIQWLCAGALVSSRHVITAGHCVIIPRDKTLAVVRLGDLDLEDGVPDGASPKDIAVESASAHTEYRSSAKVNDIAIVRLRSAVQFNDHIQPICLPNTSQLRSSSLVGRTPYVAGWGAIFFRGPATKSLQQVDVDVTDEQSCRTAYQSQRSAVIDNRVVCAGKPGKDACQGDSGGPLMLDQDGTYYLIGVVSYGKNCAEPGYPGVYTRVTSFMDWINRNLT